MNLAFASPLLLLALAALPLLWLLIRFVPPPERVERFPPVALLLQLRDKDARRRSAPLWLVLLRLAAAALAILGLAGPALDEGASLEADRPIALMMDGGWASAPDWDARRDEARALLARAERSGIPVALARLSDIPPAEAAARFRPAREAISALDALEPRPWAPHRADWVGWAAEARERGAVIHWFHDGLNHGAEGPLIDAIGGAPAVIHLRSTDLVGLGGLRRTERGAEADVVHRGPGGNPMVVEARDAEGRTMALAQLDSGLVDGTATVDLEFPSEILGRIAMIRVRGHRSAAAVRLLGDQWQRPRVGMPVEDSEGEAPPLLRGAHYVRTALAPASDIVEAELLDLAVPSVDAVILVDHAAFGEDERRALEAWVEAGGLLVRFAGPRLARWSETGAGLEPDPLLPVRLSPGGRDLGGAMSWRTEQPVTQFNPDGPFADLLPSAEMLVKRQILAVPDAVLRERVWAELADRTPLVTARTVGSGEVVLFHSTAEPGWSTLSLTGGFSEMLSRVVRRAGRTGVGATAAEAGWTLESALNPWGSLEAPPPGLAPVSGLRLDSRKPGPDAPPGIYANESHRRASDVEGAEALLGPDPVLPEGAEIRMLGGEAARGFGWILLLAALALVLVDGMASLWTGRRARGALAALFAVLVLSPIGEPAAQVAPYPALQTALGYVETGDLAVDRMSRDGLAGLGRALARRTSVKPVDPVRVRLGEDDISVLAFLYWPVVPGQTGLSQAAAASMNRFLATGGLLVLDTQDGGVGTSAPALQRLLRQLALPALAPAGPDHVITRTYYLTRTFPGRWREGRVWVAREDAESSHTDNVSPVVVGAADWASAWAQDDIGRPVAVIGVEGAGQRELAVRAGINFVMYALTGNYKTDQVHLPAILERLGLRN